jgi:integrase
MKLDARTVASLELPADKSDQILFDSDLSGFGYRLRKRGDRVRRSWVVQYRARGRTRRVTLGSAETLKASEAREAAREVLAKVTLGGDPQGDRAAERQHTHTLRSLAASYLEAKKADWRPSSYRVTKLYLTGAYFKPLHRIDAEDVTRRDVAARLGAIKRASGDVSAKQARTALSSLFKWAMGEGLVSSNPIIGTLTPGKAIARERVLDNRELAAIWNACQADDFGRATRLLILLGNRRSEVGELRFSELDFDAGTWTLPGQRSKNHRSVTITLPAPALAIIQEVPRTDRDQLFGARAAGFTAWDYGKRELDRRLGDGVKPWKLHDIRRTVATRMADIGIQPHIIEAVLNHYSGHRRGIAGVYNRSTYQREVATALATWGEYVMALVEKRPSKVTVLHA